LDRTIDWPLSGRLGVQNPMARLLGFLLGAPPHFDQCNAQIKNQNAVSKPHPDFLGYNDSGDRDVLNGNLHNLARCQRLNGQGLLGQTVPWFRHSALKYFDRSFVSHFDRAIACPLFAENRMR